MEESEKSYIQALIQEFKPTGNVLEIGYSEISRSEINKFQPEGHTVIEHNPSRIQEANTNNLTLIDTHWKSAFDSLDQFESILINGYPRANAPSQKLHLSEFHEAKRLVEEGKKLTTMVAQLVPNLTAIKYSDEDLDLLLSDSGQGKEEELIQFLEELKNNEQISPSQYDNSLEKLSIYDHKPAIATFWKYPNRFLEFLQLYLEKALRPGGRLCCYIDANSSKYDDPSFFNAIITNPSYTYEEKVIPVGSSEALAMVIQKNQ